MPTTHAPHEHGRIRRPSPLSECGSAVTLTNRRVDWLITQADLPGLVDGSMLADEFHHVHPGRPVLYAVAPGEKGSATEQDTLLDTPLLPAQVVERVLALSKGQGVHASGLPRWAA